MAQVQTVNRIFKLAVFCALVVLTLAMFQGSLYLFSNGGENPEGKLQMVEIPLGTSTAGIARILEEEGIISSALFFRIYVRVKDMDGKLQAGEYQFHENMRPADVVEKLKDGRIYREQIRFTVPEGLRVEQVANRLAAAGLGDEDTFLELMASPGEFSFSFLEDIPSGLEYPLEGYLAPNTYYVFKDASEKEVLGVLLRHFNSFYTEDAREKIEKLGLSLHDAVTLASIVERETRAAKERPVVAAVFLNRLKINMPLQSCATVQYALGEVKEVLLNDDLAIDSPYNTYLHRGLPPGPIASPGKASLEAVLDPAEVDYLYFVYRNDGTGLHYFARTLAVHNDNRRKARENRQ